MPSVKLYRQWWVSGKAVSPLRSPWSFTHPQTSSASLWKRRLLRWSRALLQTLPLRQLPKQVCVCVFVIGMPAYTWWWHSGAIVLIFYLCSSLPTSFNSIFPCFTGMGKNRHLLIQWSKKIKKSFSLSSDVHVEPHKKQLHVTLAYHFQSNHLASLEKLAKGVDITLGCDWQAVLLSRDIRFANHEVVKLLSSIANVLIIIMFCFK